MHDDINLLITVDEKYHTCLNMNVNKTVYSKFGMFNFYENKMPSSLAKVLGKRGI